MDIFASYPQPASTKSQCLRLIHSHQQPHQKLCATIAVSRLRNLTLCYSTLMIILASQSHIRSQLLQQAGLSHMVETSHVDETEIQNAIPPHTSDHLAAILSKAKAAAVAKIFPHDLVIGADQTLEFEGQTLHKSQDIAAARQTLLNLRGKRHVLHAAVTIMKVDQVLFEFTGQATLMMRQFSLNYLDQYLAAEGDNVLTSVGCYKLEGPGIQLFETIEGDYFTILGLPLLPLLAFFREIGELPS